MEKLIIGMLIGGVAGAVLTANNYKMRTLVKKSQEEVQAKLDQLMDDKIREFEEGAEKMKTEIKEKAADVKENVEDGVEKAKNAVKKATRKSAPQKSAAKKTEKGSQETPAPAVG